MVCLWMKFGEFIKKDATTSSIQRFFRMVYVFFCGRQILRIVFQA